MGVDAAAAPKAVAKAPRWRKVEPLCKSYLGNTLHVLGMLGVVGCLFLVIDSFHFVSFLCMINHILLQLLGCFQP